MGVPVVFRGIQVMEDHGDGGHMHMQVDWKLRHSVECYEVRAAS